MSAIHSHFPQLTLGGEISLMKCFANSPISESETILLKNLKIIGADGRLNKESRKLHKTLNFDAGVLRRLKLSGSSKYELDNLFKVLGRLMYGKILNLKFSNMDEAQLAASFFLKTLDKNL